MTHKQTRLMDELNFWHALLVAVQTDESLRRHGLCAAVRYARLVPEDHISVYYYGDDDDLPQRARDHQPENTSWSWYWWAVSEDGWKQRFAFIRKMIRLVEQELANA